MKKSNNSYFPKNTPELGRVPAFISRTWRPVGQGSQCTICGEHHYHILAHIQEHQKTARELGITLDEMEQQQKEYKND